MRDSATSGRGDRSFLPEFGLPLIVSLALVAATTVAAWIAASLRQGVPLWLTMMLTTAVIAGAFGVPAANRRARETMPISAWGRAFSAWLLAVAVCVPLAALIPVTFDTGRWGWLLAFAAGFDAVLLAGAVVVVVVSRAHR